MTSWCIVISEESFNDYTANGNRFYFCGNGDWWDVPCIPGFGFPRDRFDYSLIAVEVSPKTKSFQSLRDGIPVPETPAIS